MKNTYTVALAGNPNVGKSTIFNSLTGMHQHTGNWTGKTVANATGEAIINDKEFTFVDIPGTYSIMSNSEEEEIARDYICFGKPDATVIVVDSTCLERNLNLVYQIMEITDNIIVCVNLLDEAKKKKIKIDLKKLEDLLGVPVVGTIAREKQTLENLKNTIYKVCEGEIKPHTKTVIYEQEIEENLEKIVEKLDTDLLVNEYSKKRNIVTEIGVEKNKISKKLCRWIAIKLIDGEEKILKSIQENLEIDLEEQGIQQSVIEAKENLETREINSKNFKDKIVADIMKKAEETSKEVCTFKNKNYRERDLKIDKILTSKIFGIPIMILFLGLIFWITIVGANYPSEWLFSVFNWLQDKLIYFANYIHCPTWLSDMLINGVYKTLTWIVAVMLPPMAIFFPLFTILEDLGYLPRIAFNMDGFFKKACCSGKQMITMCMGFGCNACGVTGCRIIDSPRERLIAILTNNFVPCNGRFPFLITIATIFIAGAFAGGNGFLASILSTFAVIIVIIFEIFLTLITSKILSKTLLKGLGSSFILELPPYRKPQIGKILIRSLFDRTIFILGRAVAVAAPAGLIIWIMANVKIGELSLLMHCSNFLDPFARMLGLDGVILMAFILGFPANEIVFPIIIMSYMCTETILEIQNPAELHNLLVSHGWTYITGICVMLFSLLHFPCGTTLWTIKKETKSLKWTALSFVIPTVTGILVCFIVSNVLKLFPI